MTTNKLFPRNVSGHRLSVPQLLAEIATEGSLEEVADDFGIEQREIEDTLFSLARYLSEQRGEDGEGTASKEN